MFVDLTNQGQSSKTQPIRSQNSLIPALLSFHPQYLHLLLTMSILDLAVRQIKNPQRALLTGQYWRPKATTFEVISRRLGGMDNQKIKLDKRLKKRQHSVVLARLTLYTKDYQDQIYQQAS